MTEKQNLLICIGAAIGANCIPCFEHLYEKALENGVTKEEIKRAVDLGEKVKKGASLAMRTSINEWENLRKKNSDTTCFCNLEETNPCCA